jgi:Domain of unknown function (DUF4174)
MLKLPLLLLALVGTCAAQDQHPIAQLQGSSRILLVFAPSAASANFQRQLQLIERHSFELSIRNTVVVPVSTAKITDEHFSFENLPVGTAAEMADARTRFHVQPGDFLVILLNQDGTEQIRSASPVNIHELTASLDAPPLPAAPH